MQHDKTSPHNGNTSGKKTEEAFQKSEEKYRELVENINDVIFSVDTDGVITYVSPVVEQLLQYSVDEIIGHPFSSFIHPDDLSGLMHSFKATLAGYLEPYEFRIRTKGGTIIHVRTYSRPLVKGDQLIGLTGIMTNITHHKRMEEALKKSEERYRRITEVITDYIYSVRIEDGRPVETVHNPACVAVTGYAADEFQNNPYLWIDMVHEDDRESVKNFVTDVLSGARVKPLEHRIIRKDRVVRWVRNTPVLYFDPQGHLMSYDGLIQDITERKQAELALEEERASLAQKVEKRTAELTQAHVELARAARLKDEFLATMSHELRTPLNIILGMSQVLQEQLYGPMNGKQFAAVHSIEKSGRRLLELITDILDLTSIRTGELKLNIVPIAVESVYQASLQFIKQPASNKGLQVSSTLDNTVTTIYADRLRLKQILVHLLNNDVKFTPKGGTIGLDIKGDINTHMVRFSVWDTGIGIAEEDIKRLFQPFVQLDSGLSRQYEGIGLGLSLVQRLTRLHRGDISVESRIGKGSRFTVSLPWGEVTDQTKSLISSAHSL